MVLFLNDSRPVLSACAHVYPKKFTKTQKIESFELIFMKFRESDELAR